MIKKYDYKGLAWIDVENPSDSDINEIVSNYSLPIETSEEMLSPTPRQRVVRYDNCVYIVLHFPTLKPQKAKVDNVNDHRQEIDFIVGKDFLITVHYDPVRSIDEFKETFKDDGGSETDLVEDNAGFIFHKLIKHLYHSLLRDVGIIKASLHKAESSIFKGEEKRMVIELSKIHRDILRFNNALISHREAIATLNTTFRDFFGEGYGHFIHDMSSEYQRVDRRMQNNRDLLDELRHTNDSLLSAKQNEAMKGLTMMGFLTFPMMLIAAIFSMNTADMPIVSHPYGFWIILSIMLLVAIGCIEFFSYKKWL